MNKPMMEKAEKNRRKIEKMGARNMGVTIPEVTVRLGYTPNGARSLVMTMVAADRLVPIGEKRNRATIYKTNGK